MRVSAYASLTARPVTVDCTWEQLSKLLTTYEQGEKWGSAWSPITYSQGRRKAAEALAVSALCFDIDHPTAEGLQKVWEGLKNSQLHFLVAETFTVSHWRLVVPLQTPL